MNDEYLNIHLRKTTTKQMAAEDQLGRICDWRVSFFGGLNTICRLGTSIKQGIDIFTVTSRMTLT